MSNGKFVRIINCGVPPGGWQTEYGIETHEGIIHKTQGWVSANTHLAAKREAERHQLTHYTDEKGERIPA